MKKIPIVVVFLLCIVYVQSQSLDPRIDQDQIAEITYDYTKDELTGSMPFDDYFKIIYKGIDPSAIKEVHLFEINYKDDDPLKFNVKEEDIEPRTNLFSVAQRYQSLKVTKNKEHKNSSQSIVAPLDPERIYMFVIIKKNSDSNHLVINKYLDAASESPVEYRFPMQSLIIRIPLQVIYFYKDLIPLKDNLEKVDIPVAAFLNDYSAFQAQTKNLNDYYKNTDYKPVLNDINSIATSTILSVSSAFKTHEVKANSFNQIMPMFINSENAKIKALSQGLNQIKKYDYDGRIKQIKNSIQVLEKLKSETEALQLLQNTTDVNLFYSNFVINAIKTLNENLGKLQRFNSFLKLYVDRHIPEIIFIDAITLGHDLKTSNSSTLVPDVGLVNAVGYTSEGNYRYIGRPYLGINWHFAGINRSQYLREIPNRKFRHRWSLALGITLGKIDTEEFEDFYNSISPTIGMNYRLTRQIRAGAGLLFVRKKNQNPIVNNSKVTTAPYVSVTLDLGLLSEASKLTKLIGF
ncbi:MAG: hypothetical protein ACWA5P_13275 [bacterium]